YQALSYHWGIQKDEETYADLLVSLDLTRALRHIRHSSRPRHLWIDGVCIDQSSATDKIHRIQQMNQIYDLASHFIVWAG
ncbi:heterokaryon incompatibility, partial [Paraphoma chrysanthemicola]